MTQPDKLTRIEDRDIWDDLMEKIDLSGNYEAFINPRAIKQIVAENEALTCAIKILKDAILEHANKDSDNG